MAWQEIVGHDRIVGQFRKALARKRLASTFLFIGPAGIGKRTFALKLAQAMLCDLVAEDRLDPCGTCPACQQVMANTHPDLDLVAKPEDKAFIPLDLLIGDDDHRMREGLCYNLSLKPFSGKRRIAIIDGADYFNKEGANCLLKTLEEPPPKAVIILIGTSEQRQLPTIRSRCQIMRFRPLAVPEIEALLVQQGIVDSPAKANSIAERCEGSLARAAELLDDSFLEFRNELLDNLSRREFEVVPLAKAASSLVEAAGKDGALKRARLKQIMNAAVDFYRRLMAWSVTPQAATGDRLDQAVATTLRWWPGHAAAAANCIDSCLSMIEAVDSNANEKNMLECWLDELATIGRRGEL